MKTLPLKLFFLLLATLASPCSAQPVQNILVFGDSLSAGYGIARDDSWANLLQQKLNKDQLRYAVVNASISGETTAGGSRRIAKALQEHRPAVLIVALGANDGLRGWAINETEKNLDQIIAQGEKANARILLLGMRLPPNYGSDYARHFHALYAKLAKKHGIGLVPFMLEGIPPEQFQADNLHPNAAAQAQILRNVLPALIPLLKEPLIKSHMAAHWFCGMGYKEGDAANGHSICQESDAVDRPQNQCPSGCDQNGRSPCCAPWHRRVTTTSVARLAIIPFLSQRDSWRT